MRGRYAPSPTGKMHVGNASSALLAWLSARARGGGFVMRMEDLDRNRVVAGSAEGLLFDLAWLGLDWDEGPDCNGPHTPYEQWKRLELYDAAFHELTERGQLYPCFCSRKDIAAAASAPQEPGDELRYPGTCRALGPVQATERIDAGLRHAWRFRVDHDLAPVFEDLVRGTRGGGKTGGDFVVRRADGVPAYQLAVVVDDAAMGIDEVVRGDDLLPSTERQLLLFEALGWTAPVFGHVPLLLGADGVRLSKRHDGVTVSELREAGLSPEQLVGQLAHLLGLRGTPTPVAAPDLLDGFALDRVAAAPDGLIVDPERWPRVQ